MNSQGSARGTVDAQRAMFLLLLQVLHNDSYGNKSQKELSLRFGISAGQLSTANRLIIKKLKAKGIDVEAGIGECGLLDRLYEYDNRFNNANQNKQISEGKLANVFSPKANWEPLMAELIPDVWDKEWAQELYQGKKFEAAVLGPGKRQIPSAIMALKVADLVFCSLRSVFYNQDADWSNSNGGITESLPAEILQAIGAKDNPLNTNAEFVPSNCYSMDGVKGQWVSVVGNELKLNSHQLKVMCDVIESLYAGKCPGFRLHAKDYSYFVLRIRFSAGQWLLDCVNTGERKDQQIDRLMVGMPRAWPIADLPDTVRVFAKEMRQITIIENSYKNPRGIHLGAPREEGFWLDHHPSIEQEIKRKFNIVGTSQQLNGDESTSIPPGWMTTKIVPRFGKYSWEDPAWLEFVQTLVGWAGRIRLRAPDTEAEKDPMLSFCTSAFAVPETGIKSN